MRVRRLAHVAICMALQYGLIVVNTRMIARGSYLGTIGTDACIATNGLFLTKFAVEATAWPEKIAYVVGGCVGSALALWMTR